MPAVMVILLTLKDQIIFCIFSMVEVIQPPCDVGGFIPVCFPSLMEKQITCFSCYFHRPQPHGPSWEGDCRIRIVTAKK